MRYVARVTKSGPLSFRSGRDKADASTLDYVPGSTLLGGLAGAHARLRHDPEEFDTFFMGEMSRFGNLYPSRFKSDELKGAEGPVRPLPTTARSCKRFPGFKCESVSDPSGKEYHGVSDALIPWALFALSGQGNGAPLESLKTCPDPRCESSTAPFGGFYRRDVFDADFFGQAKPLKGLRTRTGINRATGTVQHGVLYSREVLDDTTFWGTLRVPGEAAEPFSAFVGEANEKGMLRIGNNRSRGFGRVNLKLDEAGEPDTTENLRERIDGFNDALSRAAAEAAIEAEHAWYLPLTLESDVVLVDRLLRHRLSIPPQYLEERWGLGGAELVYNSSSSVRVIGWNSLLGLPKPDDVAIQKGSVFLYGMSDPLDAESLDALLTLENAGIGARRREGFGRVRVANRFHWEVKGL